MTIYTIKNDYLTVTIHEKGAMLWSIKDRKGCEYLWQGNPEFWGGRAPNLFPYIGRMTEGKYTLEGKTYAMNRHGFARDMVFEEEQFSESCVVLSIKDTEQTLEHYPYHFTFSIRYQLDGRKLSITYIVKNQDTKQMFFAVGGHPGFNVPFEEGTKFEDYVLEFDSVQNAKKVEFSENYLFSGEVIPYALEDGVRLPLHHDLFDHDAVVLTEVERSVRLMSKKTKRAIRVTFPKMPYVGFWHMPETTAPFVCIEPWSSLQSREGIIEDLSTQPGLISLESGCTYENPWVIEVPEELE